MFHLYRTRAVVGCVLIALGGCAGSPDEKPTSGAGASLEHVHGLGVDPKDGVLYAGTHHGIFRVTRTSIEGPVADRQQDFMGFTVVGPGHFLASGHPGPGQDGPGALGLLESTDGGKTWKTRSLAGQADCHALAAGAGTTYCMNSVIGELLASTDLRSWDVRSAEPVFDVAVNGSDPDAVIVTTEQGLKSSSDGGRTFRPVRDAPVLLFVEWLTDDSLIGAGPDGQVFVRSPGQEAFAKVGMLSGPPEAFHAADPKDFFASVGGKIWASSDRGQTFRRLGYDSH